MTKRNEFVCPRCQHRWFDECAYGTCDRCGTFFYLSDTLQSASPITTNGVIIRQTVWEPETPR